MEPPPTPLLPTLFQVRQTRALLYLLKLKITLSVVLPLLTLLRSRETRITLAGGEMAQVGAGSCEAVALPSPQGTILLRESLEWPEPSLRQKYHLCHLLAGNGVTQTVCPAPCLSLKSEGQRRESKTTGVKSTLAGKPEQLCSDFHV